MPEFHRPRSGFLTNSHAGRDAYLLAPGARLVTTKIQPPTHRTRIALHATRVSAAPHAPACCNDKCNILPDANVLCLIRTLLRAGTFRSISGIGGQENCLPCAVGEYANNPGTATCKPCEKGRFTGLSGSVDCEDCPTASPQDPLPARHSGAKAVRFLVSRVIRLFGALKSCVMFPCRTRILRRLDPTTARAQRGESNLCGAVATLHHGIHSFSSD